MADKPQPSPGYVGMLGLTCFCMLVGIVAMALEANEYDWDPKPKATQTIALPKVVAALDSADATSAVAAKVEPKPEAIPEPKPTDVAKTEPAKPAPPPVVVPAPTATAKVEPAPAPPEAKPLGPTPSTLTLPFNKGAKPEPAPEPKPEEKKPSGPTPSPLRIGR